MKTKTKLTLVPVSSALGNLPATQPPPRKADIICALVERARVKHEEEREELRKNKETLNKKAEETLLALFKESPNLFVQSVDFWSHSAEIEYRIQDLPKNALTAVAAARNAPTMCGFDHATVKRDITAKLSGGIAGDRVKALLASPDAVKKLDETLEALSTR